MAHEPNRHQIQQAKEFTRELFDVAVKHLNSFLDDLSPNPNRRRLLSYDELNDRGKLMIALGSQEPFQVWVEFVQELQSAYHNIQEAPDTPDSQALIMLLDTYLAKLNPDEL